MFRSNWREQASSVLELPEARYEDALLILRYVYGVDVEKQMRELEVLEALGLCKLASQLMLTDLCEFLVYQVIIPTLNARTFAECSLATLQASTNYCHIGDYPFWDHLRAQSLEHILCHLSEVKSLDVLDFDALNHLVAKLAVQKSLPLEQLLGFCEAAFLPWIQKHLAKGSDGKETADMEYGWDLQDMVRAIATMQMMDAEDDLPDFHKSVSLEETPTHSLKYIFPDADGFNWFVEFSNSIVDSDLKSCVVIGPNEKLPTKTNHGWVTLAHFWAGIGRPLALRRSQSSTASALAFTTSTKLDGQLRTPLLTRVFPGDYHCQGYDCGAGILFSHNKIAAALGIATVEEDPQSLHCELHVRISVNHLYGLLCFYLFNTLDRNLDVAAALPFSHLKEVLHKDTLPVECEGYLIDLVAEWARQHQEEQIARAVQEGSTAAVTTEVAAASEALLAEQVEELLTAVRFEYVADDRLQAAVRGSSVLQHSPMVRRVEAKRRWRREQQRERQQQSEGGERQSPQRKVSSGPTAEQGLAPLLPYTQEDAAVEGQVTVAAPASAITPRVKYSHRFQEGQGSLTVRRRPPPAEGGGGARYKRCEPFADLARYYEAFVEWRHGTGSRPPSPPPLAAER
eukprot:CAMPEP_0206405620 /NCGR_PEP_ID=MMETSP0294-20121207/29211_1 /ASSEMBLY_ACC=CAM_ASM_000327 /TAXON_ID=39354 /ORGANISM="Heterosigma akashiwo, Strain CCMP2393" /LENGTH=626 /DNA_ID=CAMNT_0053864021 /DNA_START=196 /DNA_END=2079 /DNA_ORIENTATION=-